MKKYFTPELLKEELYKTDMIAASGEGGGSSSSTPEQPQSEVDNSIRSFSLFV